MISCWSCWVDMALHEKCFIQLFASSNLDQGLFLATFHAKPVDMFRLMMKLLVTFCLLLIGAPATVEGQKRAAPLTRVQTREAERLLTDLGYWTGRVDGLFDPATRFALVAFQKWERRSEERRVGKACRSWRWVDDE